MRAFIEIFVGLLAGSGRPDLIKKVSEKCNYNMSYAEKLVDGVIRILRGGYQLTLEGKIPIGIGVESESSRKRKCGRPPTDKDVDYGRGRPPVIHSFRPSSILTLPADLGQIIAYVFLLSGSYHRLLKCSLIDMSVKDSVADFVQKFAEFSNIKNIEPLVRMLIEAKTPEQVRDVVDAINREVQNFLLPIYQKAQKLISGIGKKKKQASSSQIVKV